MKRVCLLTGAGGILGSAFCRRFADRYHIVGVYQRRHPPVASQLQRFVDPLAAAAPLPENEHPIFAVQADLLVGDAIHRVIDLAMARFDRIDLVVNAAADVRFLGSLLDCERHAADLQRQLTLNAVVPIQLAAAVARQCWTQDDRAARRHIINVSSTSGLHVYPDLGQGVYSASKAALNYLTCHLAHELAPFGVRANALCPGSFPYQVSTERVADAVVEMDEASDGYSGRVVEV